MSLKGDETRRIIKDKAYKLFAEKGFKEVTMKDICQATGMSRGGLYRHYDSTEQILNEILSSFTSMEINELNSKIESGISAVLILNEILEKYKKEMSDSENSLTLAINEYFSSREINEQDNFIVKKYNESCEFWKTLISYGITRKEFNAVDYLSVFELIIFSYQGVRMYSRLIHLDKNTPERITQQIKNLLIRK